MLSNCGTGAFPPVQLLILHSEQFFAQPRAELARVLRYREVAPWAPAAYEVQVQNQGSYEPMRPETRERLGAYYRPHNEALYTLLRNDFGWQ